MTRKHRRTLTLVFFSIALVVSLFSSGLGAQNQDVVAHDAWARLPAKSKMDTAVFMVVENHSSQPRTIIGASSDDATSAELHQMTMNKMIMVMMPVGQIAVPARGKTSFDPNGFHIMVFGLKTRPAVGDKLHLSLKLDDGTTVPVEAIVKK